MLGILTTTTFIGSIMALFKNTKTIGAIIRTIGGVGMIIWALNDMYDYFKEEEE